MKRRVRVFLVLLLVVLVVALLARNWLAGPLVAENSYLLLDIGGDYAEAAPADFVGRILAGREHTLLDLLTTLKKAGKDDRIKGIVVRVTRLDVGWGKAQEIRNALLSFKATGKHLVAYLQQEVASGNREYYVSSAADEVYLPPGGTAPLTGLMSQFYFLGGVWDKLDIHLDVEKIREYKTAGDMLVNKAMTAAHREMANSLLDSINGQLLRDVAYSRRLTPAAVQAVIDQCPIEPTAFARAGLSDGVKFLDEIREELLGPDGKFLKADDYESTIDSGFNLTSRPELAVIYAVGPIQTGEAAGGLSGQTVGSDTLVDAFRKAAADDNIRAIVFRIDSPGGSALASDLIWRATQQARAKKPVIVSMSDVAGSGGYYIAAGGNEIVAQPATLTGSIGVVLAKPNVSGFLGRLGVTTETLVRGKYARLDDITSSLTPDERAKVVGAMQHVYDLFVQRVAEGRKLSADRVNEIGRGRVWTGEQAKKNGLVDELGGFTRAIDVAKEAVGIPSEQEVQLVFYPKRKSLLERLGGYVEARSAVSLPAAWKHTASAVLIPFNFPDGDVLALMGERIEIR